MLNWNPFQFQKYAKKNYAGLAEVKMSLDGALDKASRDSSVIIVEFYSLEQINPFQIQIDLFGLKNG